MTSATTETAPTSRSPITSVRIDLVKANALGLSLRVAAVYSIIHQAIQTHRLPVADVDGYQPMGTDAPLVELSAQSLLELCPPSLVASLHQAERCLHAILDSGLLGKLNVYTPERTIEVVFQRTNVVLAGVL